MLEEGFGSDKLSWNIKKCQIVTTHIVVDWWVVATLQWLRQRQISLTETDLPLSRLLFTANCRCLWDPLRSKVLLSTQSRNNISVVVLGVFVFVYLYLWICICELVHCTMCMCISVWQQYVCICSLFGPATIFQLRFWGLGNPLSITRINALSVQLLPK